MALRASAGQIGNAAKLEDQLAQMMDVMTENKTCGVRLPGRAVLDSESRAAEGQYGCNPGWHRDIRIGSVTDGVLTGFIPDPCTHGATSHPEGVSVNDQGNIWGASVGDRTVWKWVRN